MKGEEDEHSAKRKMRTRQQEMEEFNFKAISRQVLDGSLSFCLIPILLLLIQKHFLEEGTTIIISKLLRKEN